MKQEYPPDVVLRGPIWVLLSAFFVVWALRATVLFPYDAGVGAPGAQWAYAAALKVLLWAVPALIYAVRFHGRPVGHALLLSTRPRALGAAAAALVVGAAVTVGNATLIGGGTPVGLRVGPAAYLALAGAASVSVFCEELLFRGVVLGEMARRFAFWPANLITAVLFALIHWPNWLYVRGGGVYLLTESLWLVALGLYFGWLVRRTGSLWAAVVAHLMVNVLLGLMYAA